MDAYDFDYDNNDHNSVYTNGQDGCPCCDNDDDYDHHNRHHPDYHNNN